MTSPMPMPLPSPPTLTRPRMAQSSLSPRPGVTEMDYAAEGHGGLTGGGSGGATHQSSVSTEIDLATLGVPQNPQDVFKLCRHLTAWSPVHSAFVGNLSRLPVTPIILKEPEVLPLFGRRRHTPPRFEGTSPALSKVRRLVDSTLHLRKINQLAGVQYWTYGSACVLLRFPFVKTFKCPRCQLQFRADDCADWTLDAGGDFHARCLRAGCNYRGLVQVWDSYLEVPDDVRLSVPDMTRIYTMPHGNGYDLQAYYSIPDCEVERYRSQEPADREYVLQTPQAYLRAALAEGSHYSAMGKRLVKLREGQYYLMRTPGLTFEAQGLPIPKFLASFRDYWTLRRLQQATEAIAGIHITPTDFLFPDSTGQVNLFEMINVANYMGTIKQELSIRQRDPHYRPIVPFPVNSHRIGGDGKALLVSSEMRVYMEILCAALECPIEFVFGGLSYSGSDVSVNQLVQKVEDYRGELLEMNRWALGRICAEMDWPSVVVEFEEFRMGQDLPLIQILLSMRGANQVSTKRIHSLLGIDHASEKRDVLADVAYDLEIQRIRMQQDLSDQRKSLLHQTVDQARAQIQSQEAMAQEVVAVRERTQNDPEMLAYATTDPNFGALALPSTGVSPDPATNAAGGAAPVTPDPGASSPETAADTNVSATGLDAGFLAELLRSLGVTPHEDTGGDGADEGSEMSQSESAMVEDPIGPLVEDFSTLSPEQWPAQIHEIAQALGPQIAQQVQARLYAAQSALSQSPTDLPSTQRNPFFDVGATF